VLPNVLRPDKGDGRIVTAMPSGGHPPDVLPDMNDLVVHAGGGQMKQPHLPYLELFAGEVGDGLADDAAGPHDSQSAFADVSGSLVAEAEVVEMQRQQWL
jgi:hypothetical protein